MTALGSLETYLRRLEWRLRLFAASRGLAATFATALLLTLLFVYIGNYFEFAGRVVLPLRIALYAAVAAALTLALLRPLLRLNRRRVTREIERRAPEFKERLLTLAERQRVGEAGPWMELLAEDTMAIARRHEGHEIRSNALLYGFAGGFAIAAALLLWTISAGPGYWGYGASLLWTGKADATRRPLYAVSVKPGNATVRRRTDQRITAQLEGFSARDVVLHARYGKASKWDSVPMEPTGGSGAYRFTFAAVSEPVEYFVEASHSQSKHFRINVKDLPGVERIRVALRFPSELALQNVVLDPAGDIRAVKGTDAEVHVKTDKPLERGALVFGDGHQVPLTADSNGWMTAHIHVEKDDAYHVAAIDGGETVRISEDYFIEAQRDEPPTVKISRPGNDPHVSPIEEMPVTVAATDDYGVNSLELHYAVNGGPEKTYSMLKAKGAKESEGKASIAFEDLKAAPGDMVSLYAVARDAHATARSEIIFAQADAFDYKFSQSQQAGGGGGGGGQNEADDIPKRQKQIIAATFNQMKNGKTGAAKMEDAKFLAGEQAKLSEQAQSLAARMSSRELGASGKQFEEFAKLLLLASADMGFATDQLKPGRWNDALPPEQKALSSLLRAESLFRDIQVSMSKNGGGGGGQSDAGRDLARMFDLELDTNKNQYETGQQAAPQQQADKQQAMDKARQRLEELARRQQELAKQPMTAQQFEQRWQEEQLRREAEELKRQMQEMAKNSQGQDGQQQSQQQGRQSSQGQQGQQGQQNQQGQQGQPGQQGQQSQGQQSAQSASQQPSSSGSPQSGTQRAGSQQSGAQQGASQRGGAQQAGSQQSGSQLSGSQQSGQQQQTAASRAQSREEAERMNQALREATRAIDKAEEAMRQSVSNHDRTAGARAAEQLRQAQETMARAFQKQAGGTMSDLANQADQIASAQRGIADKMKGIYGTGANRGDSYDRLRSYANMGGGDGASNDANAMPEMNDPTVRYRRGYGRRMIYMQPGREPTTEEKALADEKEKLAAQVENLQRQVGEQARSVSGARPDASAKMMRALSDAEGRELALRLQKNAEWMRQGFGDRNLSGEDSVTKGLQQLGRALHDVEVSLSTPDPKAEARSTKEAAPTGTRTPTGEQSPAQYRDAVAGYFKKLSQAK